MDILKAGNTTLQVLSLFGAPDAYEGKVVGSIRVSLPEDITEEQITDLLENPWNHYSEGGELIAVHSGCNMVKSYEITFLKVPDQAKLMDELTATAEELAKAQKLAEEKHRQAEGLENQLRALSDQMQAITEALQVSGMSMEALMQARTPSNMERGMNGQPAGAT